MTFDCLRSGYFYGRVIELFFSFQIYLHCNKGKDEVSMLVAAKTSGATPLVIACRNGHYDVAEYLIEKCNADIEQPGSGRNFFNVPTCKTFKRNEYIMYIFCVESQHAITICNCVSRKCCVQIHSSLIIYSQRYEL